MSTKEQNSSQERYNLSAMQEIEFLREQLEQARKELQFIQHTQNESLSMLAHELRSPFQEIDLFASFIQEDEGIHLSSDAKGDLSKIRDTCTYGIDLIKKLIDYTQISQSEDRAIIPMESLVQNCFRQIIKKEPDRTIELHAEQLPDLYGDTFLLEHIVRNLLSNSVKYTRKRASASIRVRSNIENNYICLYFSDNGIGLPADATGDVFRLFERAHNESEYEGHGIGLATVKKIASQYGGEVSIYSEPDKGCEVTVRLPVTMLAVPRYSAEIKDLKENNILIGVHLTSDQVYQCCFHNRRAAYELAVDEINRSGGILGRQVRLVFRDFGTDVSKASGQAWDLVQNEHVDVLMGGLLSSAREPIRHVADKTRTLYFFNSLYEGGVADHYTFFTSIVPEQGIFPALDHLIPQFGNRCYIIVSDYNYGILNAERLKRYLALQGASPVAVEYFFTGKSDFNVTISNILQTLPDIVVAICAGEHQNEFHRQWHEKGLHSIPVFASIGVPISGLHKTYPAPTMENTYFMCSYEQGMETEAAAAFTAAMQERMPGSYIDLDAESAYTAVYLYKNAVEMAGTTETEAVIHALESGKVQFAGPGGTVIVRGEDHHVIRDVALYRTNEKHENELIAMYPALYSDYIEHILKAETGAKHGLKSLGRKAPNVQYNPMYHNAADHH